MLSTPVSDLPFAQIRTYDTANFGDDRSDFLQSWLKIPNSLALAHINHKSLQGYGVIRPCRFGYKIGPLFADNQAIAHQLYSALCQHLKPDDLVYLDIPEINLEAIALANNLGMTKVFETARMCTKPQPNLDLSRVFGITTFELG